MATLTGGSSSSGKSPISFVGDGPGINVPELGGATSIKSFAQQIARLQVSGGDGPSIAKGLLKRYGADIPAETLAANGLQMPKGDKSIFGRLKDTAGGVLGGVLDLVSRPGQAVLEGVQAVRGTLGLTQKGTIDEENSYGDIFKALKGDQTHHLNLREAVGRDPHKGGLLAGFFDTVGSAALDPLTWVTAGTAAPAEAGLKIAGEETAARIAARGGLKNLGEKEIAELSAKIAGSEQAANASKSITQSILHPALSPQEAYTQRVMQSLKSGGEGGIKFMGQTVPGLGGANLKAARTAIGVGDETAAGIKAAVHFPAKIISKVTSPLTEKIGEAVIPRYHIIKEHGAEYASRLADARSGTHAGFQRIVNDATSQVYQAAREAGITDSRLGLIRNALEGNNVAETAALLRDAGHEGIADTLETLDKLRHTKDAALIEAGAKTMENQVKIARQEGQAKVLKKFQEEAQKPIPKLERESHTAARQSARRQERLQSLRDDLAALEGTGREFTSTEHQRIGAEWAKATASDTRAAHLEARLAKAEEAAPGVRDHAFADAVDEAMAKLPAVRKTRAETRLAADQAAEKLHQFRDELTNAEIDGLKITERDMQKLGRLEGEAKILEQQAVKSGSVARRFERGAAEKMKGAGAVADKAAETASFAKAAEKARTAADVAAERLSRIQDEIAAKAATGTPEAASDFLRRLGRAEEAAKSAERVAKGAEDRLAAQRERFRTIGEVKAKKIEKAGDKAARKYIKNNWVLMNTDTRLLHDLTPEGRKGLENAGIITPGGNLPASELNRILGKGGKFNSRTIEGSIDSINQFYSDLLKTPGMKYLEDNPLTLTLKDIMGSYRTIGEVKYLQDVAKIGQDLEGQAGILFGTAGKKEMEEKGLKFVEMNTPTFGKIYVDPVLKPEIEKLAGVLYSDKAMKNWSSFIDKWGSLWAGYATTPVLFGTGFFARNAMGNMFNNFLAGVTDPLLYIRAYHAERAYNQAIKETGREVGPQFEAAFKKNLEDRYKKSALLKASPRKADAARDTKLFQDALDTGVHETGYFEADPSFAKANSKSAKISRLGQPKPTTKEFLKAKASPLSKESVWLKPGADFNRRVENNARVAHFFHVMDTTGDKTMASRSVKKYLFDYGDLTSFEKNTVRKAARFYTYMRKNTPLQFAEIIHHPSKFAGLAHVRQGVADTFSEGNTNGPFPSYTVDMGDLPIGGKMFGLDTPLSAATQAVEPAIQLIANALPAKALRSVGLENLRPEGGFGEVAKKGLGQYLQGGPVELGKYGFEQATGKSLFTGAAIKKGGANTLERLANAILPLTTKAKKTATTLKNSDGRDVGRIRLLNTLLGFHVTPLDTQSQATEYAHRASLTADAIQRLKDEGVNVPTISELQTAGIVPPPPPQPKSTAKTLTKEQKKQEAIAQLNTAGVDTSGAGTYAVQRKPASISKKKSKTKKPVKFVA